MAITHVSFGTAIDNGRPVIAAVPAAVETLTANGTTEITAKAGQICTISTDTSVYVGFGTTPTAAADTGHFIASGATRDFGFLQEGWKVAVTAA